MDVSGKSQQHSDFHMTLPLQNHVWMDLTTTSRADDTAINGTTRTELRLAQELGLSLGDCLRYCRYSRNKQVFEAATLPAASSKEASTRKKSARTQVGTQVGTLGRKVERALRRTAQESIRQIWRHQRLKNPESAFPLSEKGDVLFFAGETWSRQYDLDVLRALGASGRRTAFLCQDVIPISHPHFFDSVEFINGFMGYFRFMAQQADLIVAISQSTKSEILKFAKPFGGVRGEVAVVELGSDIEVRSATKPVLPPDLSPGAFVIAVSTIQSRKNFDLLYKLWRRFAEEGLDHIPRLLIVGKIGFGTQDLIWQIKNDPCVADRIALLHSISDTELAWLYRNCAFSLYPSLVEGWGLPISESLAFGKMCIASNASSMPEAGAGLAIHIDPLDFHGWYRKIRELVENPSVLPDMNADIARRYKGISWSDSGSKIAAILNSLLNAR